MTRVWIIALCAGCSLPSATFTGTGGDGGTDAPAGPRIDVSVGSLQAREGIPIVIEVQLGEPPGDDTAVTIVPDDPALGVTPNMLTFSTTNWSMAQLVTVRGADDLDAIHLRSNLLFSAPEYADTSLPVTVEDNDLLNAPVSVGICYDAGAKPFPVKLDSAPLTNTMVLISNPSAVVGIDRTTLIFTPSDFDIPQAIIVTPLESTGGGVILTVSADGQTPRPVNVNVGASGKCV